MNETTKKLEELPDEEVLRELFPEEVVTKVKEEIDKAEKRGKKAEVKPLKPSKDC